MYGLSPLNRVLSVAAILVGALLAAVPVDNYGEPPPWAPADGWRKKNDPYYQGYTGKRWDNDYGIASGNCNREAVGAVVGGVVGAAVGSQVGRGDKRKVAILLGTIAGAVIGAQVGRDLDQADRACIAHSLELAGPKKRISWQGADKRTNYLLTPGRGFKHNGQECREFSLRATGGDSIELMDGKACRSGDGAWHIIG